MSDDLSPVSPVPQKNEPKRMTFSEAIEKLAQGAKITKLEWNNEDYCLLRDGFLEIYRNEKFHRWMVSEGDLIGLDWILYDN